MLIAYLDEFGHVGPYLGHDHPRFNQHPIFGYAGFVVPAGQARQVGASFKRAKRQLFKTEIDLSATPSQWERKGSEYFSTGSIAKRPEQVRVFNALLRELYAAHGQLFYYGDQKQEGTLKQTGIDSTEITRRALREAVNRLCTHAERQGEEILLIMDSIEDKARKEVVAEMYAHIFNRSRKHHERPEMLRIVEAPLHIESKLNNGIQFADWICALTARISHWQMVGDSPFGWAPEKFGDTLRGHYTYESKLHLLTGRDINHSGLLQPDAGQYAHDTIGGNVQLPTDFFATLRNATIQENR